MTAVILRADARRIPLADESVDLIVCSPPYWALRSYRDSGGHYAGQIGSESHPREWLEAMWEVLKDCWRVLKPEGSCFINLGDKRVNAQGGRQSSIGALPHENVWREGGRERTDGWASTKKRESSSGWVVGRNNTFGRVKSKMLLPHRFAIGCEDGLADPEGKGWIVRQDIVWQKLNGLPESVTDRCRDSHEFIFHLTKSERYYSAVDEIREPHTGHRGNDLKESRSSNGGNNHRALARDESLFNPLGKLPGSVWPIASEPLIVPEWAQAKYDLPDHFAAWPQEIPRRIILGWSPPGICLVCGEGRRPVVERSPMEVRPSSRRLEAQATGNANRTATGGTMTKPPEATILGYACACTPLETEGIRYHSPGMGDCEPPYDSCQDDEHWREQERIVPRLAGWTPPPTRPARVLDPFVGTGTTVGVAEALGREGIGLDLSHDYARLARWRIRESGHFKKAEQRTWQDRQGRML